jgi:hypothetical protein
MQRWTRRELSRRKKKRKGRAWLTGGVKKRSAQKRQSVAQPSREPVPCTKTSAGRPICSAALMHRTEIKKARTNRQQGAALSGLPARKIDTCLRETNQCSTSRICTTGKLEPEEFRTGHLWSASSARTRKWEPNSKSFKREHCTLRPLLTKTWSRITCSGRTPGRALAKKNKTKEKNTNTTADLEKPK